MTLDEYKKKLKEEADEEYKKVVISIQREYAYSNSTVKIGDTVTDHIGSVLVESIGFTSGTFGYPPYCVYTGLELKKDGTPTKKLTKRTVHQINLEEDTK